MAHRLLQRRAWPFYRGMCWSIVSRSRFPVRGFAGYARAYTERVSQHIPLYAPEAAVILGSNVIGGQRNIVREYRLYVRSPGHRVGEAIASATARGTLGFRRQNRLQATCEARNARYTFETVAAAKTLPIAPASSSPSGNYLKVVVKLPEVPTVPPLRQKTS
jgi:hypothetical protein